MQSAHPACTLWELPEDELQLCNDITGSSQLTAGALAALDAASAAALPDDGSDLAAAAAGASVVHACKTCGAVEVDTPEEWRAHFRSDWHRFNLRRRTTGRPAVDESEFGAMVTAGADDVGSISGSESDESEDEDRLLACRQQQQQQQRAPHFVFGPPGGRRLSVWRALVAPEPPEAAAARGAVPPTSPQDCLAALRALHGSAGGLRAAVIMLRGGHFAAAVFALQPARVSNPRLSEKERFGLVAHKSAHRYGIAAQQGSTAHSLPQDATGDSCPPTSRPSTSRYVVRAGQGGKQSSKDASGKFARSAGSRLRRWGRWVWGGGETTATAGACQRCGVKPRLPPPNIKHTPDIALASSPRVSCRYNEAALQRDVEEGLRELGPALASCHLLFLHAPGPNAQQLLGGEAPPLGRADPRLRRVPFTTRRPTLSEAQRVMRLLVTVWSLEDMLGQQAAAAEAETVAGQKQQPSAEEAAAEAAERERKQQQRAAAASRAAEAAAVQAAAEAEAQRRRADKRARQRAAKEEQRCAAAAARREEAAAPGVAVDAAPVEDDLISAAAARVAAASSKLEAKPAKVGGGGGGGIGQAKASGGAAAVVPRAPASRPRPGEDAALRRARMAAAAEARAKALEAAMAAQRLH